MGLQSWVAPRGQAATNSPLPPPVGGAIQVVCLRGPPVYRGCSIASGTSPVGPMGREALGAPWDPSNCRGGTHRPWDSGPCRHATPPVPCGNQGVWGLPSRTSSPPSPGSRGAARQYVSLTWRLHCPGPYLPRWAQCQAPPASPPRPGAPGLHTPRKKRMGRVP